MLRLALLLLAVSGCDLALGVTHVSQQQSACGPYAKVTEVPISGVVAPRNFSISIDGSLALVIAQDTMGQTRPIPLRFDGSAWSPDPDPAMHVGLNQSMKAASIAPYEPMPIGANYTGEIQPAMLVSELVSAGSTKLQVGRYYWSEVAWTIDTNQQPISLAGFDIYPGNVWVKEGAGGPNDRVRHTVLWQVAQDPTQDSNKIEIAANTPPSFTLEDKARTIGLNNTGLNLTQAVMTVDRSKLVFSTKTGAHADIYAVEQSAEARTFDDFGVSIGGVNTGGDELEPWINADCTKLYFRRVGADEPSSSPGRIYVAE